jgi:phosphatidylserine/phosphatidylglycerophosphate/cardiolipin synthase-like enzyme
VIFERDQVNQWSEYNRLKSAGIPVMLDENAEYMHNKFMVIDGKVVLTGSYNYSKQADTQNDENLIVIVDEAAAKAYEDEFNEMWGGKFGS